MSARNLGVVFGRKQQGQQQTSVLSVDTFFSIPATLMRSPDPAREFGDMVSREVSEACLVILIMRHPCRLAKLYRLNGWWRMLRRSLRRAAEAVCGGMGNVHSLYSTGGTACVSVYFELRPHGLAH